MDKNNLIKKILTVLEDNLQNLITAALEAKAEATSEESKAENKYDTRGLEASYLAGAQAKRADELKSTIDKISKMGLKIFDEDSSIDLTALVTLEDQNQVSKCLFILPFAGGTKITEENKEIFVITPQSPLGQKLMGLELDSEFRISMNEKTFDYTVLEIK